MEPLRVVTTDATSKESLILANAVTGKQKFLRINNGATGTLELLADNGTTKTFTLSAAGQPSFPAGGIVTGLAVVAYSASMTPNAANGNWFSITPNNGTAFTINAPNTPPAASATEEITIEIFNSSGRVLGTVTWHAAYV